MVNFAAANTKINLSTLLGQIKTQVENTEADEVRARLGELSDVQDEQFMNLLGQDELDALKALAASVGVPYAGKSLSFWENDEGIGCRLPAVQSNGKNPVLEWGGTQTVLSGAIPGKLIGDAVRLANQTATIRLELRIDGEKFKSDTGKTQIEETLADAETWEDLLPVLRVFAPYRSRKVLFEQNSTIAILASALVEKDTGNYLSVTGEENGEVFRFSLPEDAKIKEGDTLTVDKENHVLRCNGVEFESGGFLKMGELVIGKTYRAIERKESGGDYGGFYLVVPGTGNVNCNSQFERWFVGVGSPAISKDNPIEFKVTAIKETRDGKKIAKLVISQPNNKAVGLGALLGGAPAPAAASTPAASPNIISDEDW